MAKYQDSLSRVGSNRDRTALRQIFTKFLNDDDPTTLKNLTFGAGTTAILISGANTTPISITGAFTTGINIAADGTTGIAITSAFSGVNAISLAGTASTAGINLSGDHTTAITIGAQTTAGIAITGNTVNGIRIDRATYTNSAMQIGAFAASLAAGSAVVFSSTCTTLLRVYGENVADLTSAYNFRCVLGRNLISCASDTVINQETYGVTGQVVVKNGSMNHYHAGVLGTFESGTLCHVQTDYGCAAVMGRVGATNTTVESGGLLAGVMAVQNTATWTVTGKAAGFATKKTAAGVAWPFGLYMPVGSVDCGISIGDFASSYATGSAIPMSATQTAVVRFYGETTSDLTSAYNCRTVVARHLVVTASATINHESYGLIGQLCVKNTSLGHYHGGVMGTFESNTAATVLTSYGVGAVIGRVGAENTTVNSGGLLAAVLAVQNTATITATGVFAAFATKMAAGKVPFPIGLYMAVGDVTQPIRIGNWAGSGAPGSAIAISAATDSADTTQRNLVAVYGESTTDLGSGIHANIGRFRHLVVGSSLQVNHETYGLVGQVVGKSASLLHMHAGLMGTLEANTTAVTVNGAYAYSVAAVIARIGGTNLITATKPVCGFSSIHNGAALASGSSIAYAACAVSTGNWDYLLGADNCDNLLYVATGTAYECAGVKVATQLTSNAYPKMDGIIRFYVGATAYYIPFYAAGNIDNE